VNARGRTVVAGVVAVAWIAICGGVVLLLSLGGGQ
jgi:hypothetical protein